MEVDQKLIEARIARVEEHVAFENDHDLEGVIGTFSEAPLYEDEPWGEHHVGLDGVRGHYETLMQALPDLHIEVGERYVTDEVIILECVISGTHLGPWRGLSPTGRRVSFPLCAVYTFQGDRLAGERIYYDRATVLGQLGIFHEPDKGLGRVVTALTHPVTLTRAAAGRLRSLAGSSRSTRGAG